MKLQLQLTYSRVLPCDRRWHIQRLCREHDILLRKREELLNAPCELPFCEFLNITSFKPGEIEPAIGDCVARWIFLNDCDTGEEIPYMVALHEIGHIMTREKSPGYQKFLQHRRRDHEDEMRDEHLAWEWAQEHALEWTARQQEWKDYSLLSYENFEAFKKRREENSTRKKRNAETPAAMVEAPARLEAPNMET